MPLDLKEQWLLVTDNQDFRGRVASALVATAIAKFGAAPDPDAAKQARRLQLAHEVLNDPNRYLTQFGWIVVTRPSLPDAPEAISDADISGTVTATFDPAAQQLVDLPAP